MMSRETRLSTRPSLHFKISKKASSYHAAYDRSLVQWKIPVETFYVPTHFGSTHIIACGAEHGETLILLHAMGFSSTVWQPNIEALASNYKIYAIDYIGDLNKSVPEMIPATKGECGQWLNEVLECLDVRSCRVGGISYGGFLAMNYAIYAPDKVKKLFLLSPAASFVPLHDAFIKRIITMAAIPMKWNVQRFMKWLSQHELNPLLVDQFHAAFKYGTLSLKVPPSVYSDEELDNLTMPVLLLLGDQEVISDAKQAYERAVEQCSCIEAELIAGVGHLLNLEKPEYVNQRVLTFISQV